MSPDHLWMIIASSVYNLQTWRWVKFKIWTYQFLYCSPKLQKVAADIHVSKKYWYNTWSLILFQVSHPYRVFWGQIYVPVCFDRGDTPLSCLARSGLLLVDFARIRSGQLLCLRANPVWTISVPSCQPALDDYCAFGQTQSGQLLYLRANPVWMITVHLINLLNSSVHFAVGIHLRGQRPPHH